MRAHQGKCALCEVWLRIVRGVSAGVIAQIVDHECALKWCSTGNDQTEEQDTGTLCSRMAGESRIGSTSPATLLLSGQVDADAGEIRDSEWNLLPLDRHRWTATTGPPPLDCHRWTGRTGAASPTDHFDAVTGSSERRLPGPGSADDAQAVCAVVWHLPVRPREGALNSNLNRMT